MKYDDANADQCARKRHARGDVVFFDFIVNAIRGNPFVHQPGQYQGNLAQCPENYCCHNPANFTRYRAKDHQSRCDIRRGDHSTRARVLIVDQFIPNFEPV